MKVIGVKCSQKFRRGFDMSCCIKRRKINTILPTYSSEQNSVQVRPSRVSLIGEPWKNDFLSMERVTKGFPKNSVSPQSGMRFTDRTSSAPSLLLPGVSVLMRVRAARQILRRVTLKLGVTEEHLQVSPALGKTRVLFAGGYLRGSQCFSEGKKIKPLNVLKTTWLFHSTTGALFIYVDSVMFGQNHMQHAIKALSQLWSVLMWLLS